jgi:hypothetical protein
MRKPISKHALRRALERVHAEGVIQWDQPIGSVVDKIWHEIEKKSYNGGRKKPVSRDTVRDPELVALPEAEPAITPSETTD